MSLENPSIIESQNCELKNSNFEEEIKVNGLSNGHVESSNKHKSSSKDKHRDKERDHKSSKHSSSKENSDRHKSSSNKDKHRDKEQRDKDKDKNRHKSSSHKSSSNRDKERSKEKLERSHDKDKKKEHKSNSHSKDKSESSSKDKGHDRHKTSSNSKDKHSNSSSSRSKDKDKHSSSSSKDKDRHREREKEKHKDHSRNNEVLKEVPEIPINKDIDRKTVNGKEINQEKNSSFDTPPAPDTKIIKNIKREMPINDYDQTCSGFPNKYEDEIKTEIKREDLSILEKSNKIKYEMLNMSQASSCDYSMSQFQSNEPSFQIKAELTDDSQEPLLEIDQTQNSEVDEEDIPLAKRKMVDLSDDDVPLISRKKIKKEKRTKKKKKRIEDDDEDSSEDEKPKKKKIKKEKTETKPNVAPVITPSPTKGRKKKEEETQEVWKWWEEEKRDDRIKWNFLEHKGPVFAPEYEPLPQNIKFYYDGNAMKLSNDSEEIACFYAKMLNHDYVTKKAFNDNFFKDWRKSMTSKEREKIKDLSKCNFEEMHQYFQAQSEKNKSRTKEEKLALKEANEKLIQEYGFCVIDGHKERIGNFKIEPPGLFRGRGEHPKMGLVKRRIMPEDISINCSKNSRIPEAPKGHKWKEVRHDNSVTWLASWIENVQGQVKYIMLNPSSKLKGEKDYQKYEVARRLDKHIEKIRATYKEEWKSKEMRIRQRGVALYFIDRLALRAGNEKDEDQADTVGCCSLRVEHVSLHKELNGKENVVVFDFLGKDSIRYYNEVEVEKRVFKNLELFMENKKEGDDLFDRLNTAVLNEHLRELMEGLTAKVFRTYNASITLQNQLDLLTDADASIPEKLLSYNRANRAVAVLCNHQRSVPKSHAKSMENLKEKIRQKRELIEDTESELHDLQKAAKRGSVKEKINYDKKKKQVERLKEQLKKLELQETDRDENKTIALGTSKLNYLDPRISVAWCKKYNVPIEKIFNKTQRDKFRWAIHMANEDYRF